MKAKTEKAPEAVLIVYVGEGDGMLIPDLQVTALRGKPVAVPADKAAEFLARPDWAPATKESD